MHEKSTTSPGERARYLDKIIGTVISDDSLRIESTTRIKWRPIPDWDRLSPFVCVVLRQLIDAGKICSVGVEIPGVDDRLLMINSDLACFIEEFAYLLVEHPDTEGIR
jgi:hypothetical protein